MEKLLCTLLSGKCEFAKELPRKGNVMQGNRICTVFNLLKVKWKWFEHEKVFNELLVFSIFDSI